MRSPFPGMNPYLENPELWSEVHSRLIVAIADDLTDHLSEKYRVAIEKRTYFSGGDDSLLVGIPDVSVVGKSPEQSQLSATATLPVEPITVTVPMAEDVQERYLEIREVATGSVITTIEILSPKNKRSGEGRQAYNRKRHQVLASLTHLVEIDLLRGGQPLPILGVARSDYRILISRSDRRPSAQLYAFSVRQRIPQFTVPLAAGDEEPVLDLQSIVERVYERGRYYLAIDYTQPAQPPLSEQDAIWATTIVQNYFNQKG
ncbi:DUF4058 family protein [Leptolyngbya sp. NK1-12]|uniref:DUF4058 family protein n=1 Tax=Leptolyngbya sp. NK1-12 TaxID=2547451 RepID=A0AA96WCF8_9CYAN|nr:DUF4058 family protein [Leptolyngbya sp. NK1-12]WNZ22390.1 DUF4058 family protein [Leptolyngbya sp. NK1-12]